jgi:Uma2 family endonuclease
MVASPIFVTAEEFDSLPEQLDPIELIGGEIFVSPTPTRKHQWIAGNLHAVLRDVEKIKKTGKWTLSPTEVYISDRDIFQPDIVLYARDAMPNMKSRAAREVPLIVVEVLSPGTRSRDLVLKLPKYAARGIAECWIVDAFSHELSIFIPNTFGNLVETVVGQGPITVGIYVGLQLPFDEIFEDMTPNSWD